jgi:hypothetical protein
VPIDGYGEGAAFPGNRWFVVTPRSDPERVLDRFEAAGWAPVIPEYAERLRRHAYPVPVALREARPSEA